MLCNKCIHNNVCKHTELFKEYDKQYQEMRKISSLFDKPIECPCHEEKEIKDYKEAGEEIRRLVLKANIIALSNETIKLIKNYEDIIKDLAKQLGIDVTNSNIKDVSYLFDKIIESI